MEAHEDIVVEERDAQPTVSIRQTIPVSRLTEAQGASLRELWTFLTDRGLRPAGPPFVRYHTFGEIETDLETGVPLAEQASGEGRIASGSLPEGPAISTWHFGSHDRLGEAYGRLRAWARANSREPKGAAWETYYWIDLSEEPDPSAWPAPSDWRTQLIQPI
jgi:effector-binding domain-containing protein